MRKDFRIAESIETLQNQGPATITTEDLLAIIIGNREKAGKLLHQDETLFSGQKDGLSIIAGEDYDGLKYRAGLSQVEATRIMAAIEIGKRIAYASAMECQHITSPVGRRKILRLYRPFPYKNLPARVRYKILLRASCEQ